MSIRQRVSPWLLAVCLCTPVTAAAQDDTNTGKELVGNEMNPSLSFILDFTSAYFSNKDHVPLGAHAPESSGMSLTGAELAASANVDPYFRFDAALCVTEMELEEFYLTTLDLPLNLQARAGLFLAKLGRVNNTHAHSWTMGLAPLPNRYLFGEESLGGPGVEISWLLPLPWYTELTVGTIQGEGGAFKTKDISEGDPRPQDFIYPARLASFFELSDDWSLQAAANAVTGPSAMGSDAKMRSSAFGLDLYLKYRPIGWGETGSFFIALTAEGWYRVMEAPSDTWKDAGGYADLTVGLSKRWELAFRGELWRLLEGADPTAENMRADFGRDTNRLSAALLFLPSHFSKLRLQYTAEEVQGFDLNHIVLLQIEISAGAHGAHSY